MGWPYKSDGRLQRVAATDWRTWTPWIWWLHGLAIYYVAAFLWFWFRFQAAERAAKSGDAGAVERFNAMIRGFPNAVFAKMFGKRAFETPGKGQLSEPEA
jgi:hypothetical protein